MLIDVAPSINLLQTCAMTYARSLLIPVSMDPQPAGRGRQHRNGANLEFSDPTSILPVAILPVMVDRRFQITEVVSTSLEELSARTNIPLLPSIRTDTTVTKCSRAKQFLVDFDPRAKALEDYHNALGTLVNLLGDGNCHRRDPEETSSDRAHQL